MLTPQSAGLSQYQPPTRLSGFEGGQITVSTKDEQPWLLYLGLVLLAYYLYSRRKKASHKRATVEG